MNTAFLLGSFGDLSGRDMLRFLAFLVVNAGVIACVIILARLGTSSRSAASTEARLRKLDALHRAGSMTDAEHEQQRQRILTEI